MENKKNYYLFTVDYENNAEKFWQGTGGAAWNFALRSATARNLNNGEDIFSFEEGEAHALVCLFESCPGWNDGSERAPHPIYVEKGLTWSEVVERMGR